MKPDHFKWIIIKNKTYNHMRTFEHYENFGDLLQTENDAINVRKGILELGGREEDIQQIDEADFPAL